MIELPSADVVKAANPTASKRPHVLENLFKNSVELGAYTGIGVFWSQGGGKIIL